MNDRRIRSALSLLALLAIAPMTSSCGKKGSTGIVGPAGASTSTGTTASDIDHDGIPDSRDNCPTLPGEAAYNGCPWYKVDVCSAATPYALLGHRWATLTPAFYYGSSLPSGWRAYADNGAATWNSAGSGLSIKKYLTISNAGVANDGINVVCYGPISGSALGQTYWWYNPATGYLTDADIKLNSNQPMNVGGDASHYDVVSVLVHEFGHFCGLDHVNDRTQTMFPSMPTNCVIPRTLCGGDILGIRRLYP